MLGSGHVFLAGSTSKLTDLLASAVAVLRAENHSVTASGQGCCKPGSSPSFQQPWHPSSPVAWHGLTSGQPGQLQLHAIKARGVMHACLLPVELLPPPAVFVNTCSEMQTSLCQAET